MKCLMYKKKVVSLQNGLKQIQNETESNCKLQRREPNVV